MTDDKPTREQRIVFGYSPGKDQQSPTTLLLGVPTAAWEYMRLGKTHLLDLSSIGVPIQVIIYGGKDQDSVRKVVEEHNRRQGIATLDLQREDFTIKDKT